MMRAMLLMPLALLLSLSPASAARAKADGDACHVYLIDQEAAQKASDAYDRATTEKQRAQAMASGWLRILGEFSPKIGEEELTTKTYPLPGSSSFITASIFYTDEMMPSATTADSMLLSIVVADRPQDNALQAPNNAVTEVTYNEFIDTVRVKTNVNIKGRTFLVGLQCNHQQPPPRK